MNNKMTINRYLSIIVYKKQTKQRKEQRHTHGYGEHFDGCQMGGDV